MLNTALLLSRLLLLSKNTQTIETILSIALTRDYNTPNNFTYTEMPLTVDLHADYSKLVQISEAHPRFNQHLEDTFTLLGSH